MHSLSRSTIVDRFAALVARLCDPRPRPTPVFVPVAVRQPVPVRIPVDRR